jgi:transketolase
VRKQFCDALVARAADPELVFLTGDLGFMALEPLAAALGPRFINAGVSEQNMISVAAAMAKQGLRPWAYSIAPFCYARPYEQIRNDITLHDLPVRLVGNGGGYGYGVMGPTHHALEDYGVLLTLPGVRVFTPSFDEDVGGAVEAVSRHPHCSYLRLGRGEGPRGYAPSPFSAWRRLCGGASSGVIIAVGPLASAYLAYLQDKPVAQRPALWALGEMPVELEQMPVELLKDIAAAQLLVVAEEHVAQGGAVQQIALALSGANYRWPKLIGRTARHQFERYGSQSWLRREAGLDPETVMRCFENVDA